MAPDRGPGAFGGDRAAQHTKGAWWIKRILLHGILICGGLVFILPFLWLVSTSLKPVEQTMRIPPEWIPNPIRWQNYKDAVNYIPFWDYALNTLKICLFGVLGTVLSCSLAAFGFSRLEWKGRDALFMLTLATMMVPFPVVMVPLYGVFKTLGWVGSVKPLIVPAFFGGAFNIFLLRQFFMTIPKDLQEAARIDGCSELGFFWRIMVPLSRPALTVVALFYFIYAWNDFLGPLIYLTRQDTFTLSLGLQFYQSQHGGTQWHLLMAASTMVIAPIIVLFFVAQKTFIQGIALTGIKG